MNFKLVGVDESRKMDVVYNVDGSVAEIQPVTDTYQVCLSLELPDGDVVRVSVDPATFTNQIVPQLKNSGS